MARWNSFPTGARLSILTALVAAVAAPFVTGSEVGVGVVLTVWGVSFVVMLLALSRSDEYMRSVSESRVKLGRFLHPSWTGLDREEWVRRDARQQRLLMRYMGVAFGLLFTAGGMLTLIVGLTRL